MESTCCFPPPFNDYKRKLIARAEKEQQGVCGLYCANCFMGQWCGGCLSALNMCSCATMYEDNVCENVRCAQQKQRAGCYQCPELEKCDKGFYAMPGGAKARECARRLREK